MLGVNNFMDVRRLNVKQGVPLYRLVLLGLCMGGAAILSSCSHQASENMPMGGESSRLSDTHSQAPKGANKADMVANAFFDQVFSVWLSRSPQFQTILGDKTDYDKWDDTSESFLLESHLLAKKQLSELYKLDKTQLSAQVALSYRLMEQTLLKDIESYQWRHHNYPINQMFGSHSGIPSLLINQHLVTDINDAQSYIERIKNVVPYFKMQIDGLKIREEKGIIAPRFVFPLVIDDSRNLLKGQPFDSGVDSPVFADFKSKVEALSIDQQEKAALIAQAKDALLGYFAPAYQDLIAYMEKLYTKADDRAGAWKFPDGDKFYATKLKQTTTTDLSADEIHQLGLSEVARIHEEMKSIMKAVHFEGSLQEFFSFMRDDPQFYYESTDEGREAYLTRAREVLADFTEHLDEVFITKPKSELTIKRVEAFREKSAGKAFYNSPPPDGSRPGIYYANLYNMKEMPKYQLEALLYHEGLPGHHLQLSIATELKDIPKFRKYGSYTAYIEGWGLYSELLPKEMGLYKDPYSDFGRLVMELWRACRLVTDTGLHDKKWTREQAIAYLVENTPNAERDSRRAIERYIVMPSQATAYKVGMIKIMELRKRSKDQLGDKFSLREFHERVLRLGAVPLNILSEEIDIWISEVNAAH